ncbi:MAG: metal ABC transporter permease [Sinimarinibacterium sp.]
MNAADFAFDWSIMGPPLLAGLLVAATHVLLGRRVLERGIIFIDLTIAQVAALGAIIALMIHGEEDGGWLTQLAAGIAALLAAGLLTWTERRFRHLQEALIGSLYVVSACVALLVLARNPHGAEHMQELLAGQILWVGYGQLWPVALLYAAVLAAWALWAHRQPKAFYVLFAFVVTASVQLVGVYLVFATLILPAIATHGLDERRGLVLGYTLAAAGYAIGLWLSVPFDLPAGPFIVCVLATLALGSLVIRGTRRSGN